MKRKEPAKHLEAVRLRCNALVPALRGLIEETDCLVARVTYEDDADDLRYTQQKLAERLSIQNTKISGYHLDRLEMKLTFYEMITQPDESK